MKASPIHLIILRSAHHLQVFPEIIGWTTITVRNVTIVRVSLQHGAANITVVYVVSLHCPCLVDEL